MQEFRPALHDSKYPIVEGLDLGGPMPIPRRRRDRELSPRDRRRRVRDRDRNVATRATPTDTNLPNRGRRRDASTPGIISRARDGLANILRRIAN